MIQILFALLAGILTIAAPCILPMLPIILGASVGQQSKTRPILIVTGFVTSFAVVSLVLAFLIQSVGLSPNIIRTVAITLLAIFAFLMLWPKPFELLTSHMNGLVNKANQMGSRNGNFGGFLLGLVIGIIWTPCAGPILGSILTLIATQGSSAKSITLLIAYAVGAGFPMLIIAYGSQYITTKVRFVAKYSRELQQIFGGLILILATAMYFQIDTKIQAILVENFPAFNFEANLIQQNGNPIIPLTPVVNNQQPIILVTGRQTNPMEEKIDFKNLGKAPEFSGIENWINSKPLTISKLKGKVILVDFWTYTCINCIRTLPYVTKWYDTYKDQGFVVIGVHTPEFAFEKETSNVETAIKRFGINYPVAQDNDYKTWSAYSNQYWPAEYLIDQDGNIVYTHFGEGNYDHTENAIRQLLNISGNSNTKNPSMGKVNSPEMYFGTSRLQYLTPSQSPNNTEFSLPSSLSLNNFALEGSWQFFNEKTTLLKPNGKIRLRFSSGKLFMVARSAKPITVHIIVDGKKQPDVTIEQSQLYPLFDSQEYSEHTIDIEIPDAGFEAFTFTFG